MAFKGVLPSDLWDRYDREDGFHRMMLDIEIANEINDLISEAHKDANKPSAASANNMVARRNQRRQARATHLSNTNDFFSIVEEAGLPVREVGGVDE